MIELHVQRVSFMCATSKLCVPDLIAIATFLHSYIHVLCASVKSNLGLRLTCIDSCFVLANE